MQIAGGQIPWMWQFNTPGSATCSGQASQSSGTAGSSPDCTTGASGLDGGVQQFDAMMQAIIQQLQSDAGANGSASATSSSNAPGTASAGNTQTAASTDATSDSSDASSSSTGQVGFHHHGHHHHHWDGADGQDQSLSSSDLTALQNDANSLVSALFGALQSSSATAGSSAAAASTGTSASSAGTATAASTGTSTTGTSTTGTSSSSSTTGASGPATWQNIAATFAQDLLNAMQAYAAQNNAAAANVNQATSSVA